MSKQAVSAFREKVNASRQLQEKIRAGVAAKNLDIVALGKAHGCDFAAEEAALLLNEAELSDFELEMVSGGGGKGGPPTRPDGIGRGAGLVAITGAA